MSNHDQLHRYLFENYAVRGELVTVSETYQQILNNHDYPAPVQKLLGELLVATSLLTATLKFDGDITVQLQGDGPLKLAVINGNNRQEMRGVARTRAYRRRQHLASDDRQRRHGHHHFADGRRALSGRGRSGR